MRSSLNITGLSPSVQQLMATPFSLTQGRSPPKLRTRMLPYIETQAEVQKPSGILRFSTMNSWPSLNSPQASTACDVAGLLSKTSDGWNLFKTVILTLSSSTISTTTNCQERSLQYTINFSRPDLNSVHDRDIALTIAFLCWPLDALVSVKARALYTRSETPGASARSCLWSL